MFSETRNGARSQHCRDKAICHLKNIQKLIACDTIADVAASGLWPGKLITQIAKGRFQ